MERIQRRVLVSGQVQGVFFRQTTLHLARDLGLSGWVRNRRDGRVEAVFQGPPNAVEQMVAWCRHGPRAAWVEHVEVHDDPIEQFPGFSVRRTE